MADPYRSSPAALVLPEYVPDPVRAAQAVLLEEVKRGLTILNDRLKKSDITSYAYEDGVNALTRLHDSIVKGSAP